MKNRFRNINSFLSIRAIIVLAAVFVMSWKPLLAQDVNLAAVREASVMKVTDVQNSEGVNVWIDYWYDDTDPVMPGYAWEWDKLPNKYRNMLRLSFNGPEMRDEASLENSPTGGKIAKGTTSFVVGEKAEIYIGYPHNFTEAQHQLIIDAGYEETGDTLKSSIWVTWVMAKKVVEAGETVSIAPELLITNSITNVIFIRKAEFYNINVANSDLMIDWTKGLLDGENLTTDKPWVFSKPAQKFSSYSRILLPAAIKDAATGQAVGPLSFNILDAGDLYVCYTHNATAENLQPLFDAGFELTGDTLYTDIWVKWVVTRKRFEAGAEVTLSEKMIMPQGNISLVLLAPSSESIYDVSSAAPGILATVEKGVNDGEQLFPDRAWVFNKPDANYADCFRLWVPTTLKSAETALPTGPISIRMSEWTEVFLCYTHNSSAEHKQPIFDVGFVENGDTLFTDIWVKWVVTTKIFAPGETLVLDGRMMIPEGIPSVVLLRNPLVQDLTTDAAGLGDKFEINPYTWDSEFVFTDRDYLIEYPYTYRGLVRVKTPNDLKNLDNGTVTFTVNDDVTVLFGHSVHSGATLPQSYVDEGFTEYGDSLPFADGAYYLRLYEKDYDKGETVTLGGAKADNAIGGFAWTAFVKRRSTDFLTEPVVNITTRPRVTFSDVFSSDGLEYTVSETPSMHGVAIYSDASNVWEDSIDYKYGKKYAGIWSLVTPEAQKDQNGTLTFTTDTYSKLFLGLADSILPQGWADAGFSATGQKLSDLDETLTLYMFEGEFEAGTYTFGGSGLNNVGGHMWVLMGKAFRNDAGTDAEETFADGADNWVTDVGEENPGKWGVNGDGWYVMNEATIGKNSLTGESMPLINDWSIWQDAWINGNFTLDLELGMNTAASGNLAEVTHHLTHVAVVFCWQDEYNYYAYLLGRSPGEYWTYEGLYKVKDGVRSNVYLEPQDEASMGEGYLEMEGLRAMQISRNGNVITVKLDGWIVAQGEDSDLMSGGVGVGEFNKGAVAVDNLKLTASSQAQPQWVHKNFSDLIYSIADSSGKYLTVSDDQQNFGCAPQGRFGKWVADGAEEGNLSWGGTGGALRLHDLNLGKTFTMEAYVKLTSQQEYSFPYVDVMHFLYRGGGWRYGVGADGIDLEAKTANLSLSFEARLQMEESITTTVDLDEWFHIAVVRDNSMIFLYIDKSEVGSMNVPEAASDSLVYPWAMVSFGKYSDLDVFKDGFTSEPYILVDRARLSSHAIDLEEDFLGSKDSVVVVEQPTAKDTGDYDGNGSLNITDVIAMLLMARDNPSDPQVDFNRDGKYTIADAIQLIIFMNSSKQILLAAANDPGNLDYLLSLKDADIEYVLGQLRLMNLSEEEMAAIEELLGMSRVVVLPKAFSLKQNYPNPFNPSTTISFDIPEGKSVPVDLRIYNLRGQLVSILVNEAKDAGTYNVFWNGKNSRGESVGSGIYFYRIKAGDFSSIRKMVLLK